MGEAVGLSVRPAGLLARAAGTIIDWAVYGGVFVGLALAVHAFSGGLDQAAVRALSIAALVLALVAVPTAVEVASAGRSAGRAALGLRIVRSDGGAASVRHAFIRALVGVVEIFVSFGSIAMLVALLDPRARRIGDFLAGTYSQLERVPKPPALKHRVPPELASWSSIADVAPLPGRLAGRIAAFLSQQGGMLPAARDRLARSLLDEAADYVWPLPKAPAAEALAAIAAVRAERDRRLLAREDAIVAGLRPQLTGTAHHPSHGLPAGPRGQETGRPADGVATVPTLDAKPPGPGHAPRQ